MKKIILSLLVLFGLMAGAKAQIVIPLTFEAIDAGTVTLEKEGDFTPNSGVQYRLGETGDWSSYSYGTGISLQAGQKLQFSSTSSDAYAIDQDNYSHFTCTADCYLYGSVGALFNNSNSLPNNACSRLFYGNTHIKSHTSNSLVLPATSLADACYQEMFSGCTALTAAPELPATSMAGFCYERMFSGCTGLTTAPALPATSLAGGCYHSMFSGCTSLTSAPELPATSLAVYCYRNMFSGCTALTAAPELPATSLANYCYENMFSGCTALASAPELPAASLTASCYNGMFSGCTALTTPPALPATSLNNDCYQVMFSGCTALASAPELPATSLAGNCYFGMFSGCTSLTVAPTLPATSLASSCYRAMFSGCTALTAAPELPASTLVNRCYLDMFAGCTNLNYVKCLATDISANQCTDNWLYGVAATGTFVKALGMEDWTTGDSGIPAGWTVENSDHPLTFKAVEAGTITVKLDEGSTLNPIQYNKNSTGWTYAPWNAPIPVDANDIICFRGNNGTCCVYVDGQHLGFRFECSNPCYVYGNMMSLIDQNGYATNTTLTETYAFYHLFYTDEPNTTILNHPTQDILLPATTLTANCYNGLFAHCQGITRAPALPATTMQEYCYQELFFECTALTTPPVLPATTLAAGCYNSMFSTCTSLASAPILPATTLASKCYYSMFFGCESLTVAPELPATELSDWCYLSMFNGCKALTTAPALPATALADKCYDNMFKGCINLTAAPELPATTLAKSCYDGMFQGCKTLTTAPALPAMTLAESCYNGMFEGCTDLTTAPALPATTLAENCYYRMFYGCKKLAKAPWLPATTLVKYCYQNMFYDCSKLNYVVCLATNISASNCVKNWLSNVAGTGTFVKASNMTSWPSGNSGIPSGWSVININQFTTDGNWNVPGNWSNNAVPEAGNSVVISANATIPIGYTANVDYIIVDEGKTLTIADGGQLIHNNAGVVATVQKSITGHGGNDNSGWYFVASPMVTNVTPAESNGFLANDYDLYYYDEPMHYWRNHKPSNNSLNPNFPIEPQKGYLYANSETITLGMTGTLQPSNASVTISGLSHESSTLSGFNLVGNPFAHNVTTYTGTNVAEECYQLNDLRNEVVVGSISASHPLKPAEGFFVKATDDGASITFNSGAKRETTKPAIQLDLIQDSLTIDRLIVKRFGTPLEKFTLRENSTRIYATLDNQDMAVISIASDSEAIQKNEQAINFKAEKNGTYTLRANVEGMDWDYLHLIDILTGADIDLLAGCRDAKFCVSTMPTYTFQAKTTDCASRFKLVFSANDEDGPSTGSGSFAYISNGVIIVTDGPSTGSGTLQVVDMMGRVIVTRGGHIQCVPTSGMTPGVYVLRLINGDNVRVQKIVIP